MPRCADLNLGVSASSEGHVWAAVTLQLGLLPQFKKGKKRAKAQEEAEAMFLTGANSSLCIALAKMHLTLAIEQVRRRRWQVAAEPAAPAASTHEA